jgi:hypothetical protein
LDIGCPIIGGMEISEPIPLSQSLKSEPEIQHEQISGDETPNQNSISEKIGNVAANLAEKFNLPFKRGRGRPRKDGLPNKSAIPIRQAENNSGILPNHAAEIKTEISDLGGQNYSENNFSLFRELLGDTIKGAIATVDKVTSLLLKMAGATTSTVDKALTECYDEKANENLKRATDALLKKKNMRPENMEEINFYMAIGQVSAPRVTAIIAILQEIRKTNASRSREIVHLDKIRELEAELANFKGREKVVPVKFSV